MTSIIGSSDIQGNWDLFLSMILRATKYINKDTDIFSGGAAWSDHIAIYLYLADICKSLTLYLPCTFSKERYIDTGDSDWRSNPGWLANKRHDKFSKLCGINSLYDIRRAIAKGATVKIYSGFHERNRELAKVSTMICFIQDEMSKGTSYSYNLCKGKRHVIDVNH